jgi:hypothetical protein
VELAVDDGQALLDLCRQVSLVATFILDKRRDQQELGRDKP